MAHWEMHPAGDEILVLVSGALVVALEDPTGEDGSARVVELRAGSAFVAPRGVWHRQLVREPGTLLAMTYGKGTEHRPGAG